MINCLRLRIAPLAILLAFPLIAEARNYCFNEAETYYQQLYCEVVAEGGGSNLPAFYDFKQNNEMIQALLLKRPASKVGIEVMLPARKARIDADKREMSRVVQKDFESCSFSELSLICRESTWQLTGNRANSQLAAGVLDEGQVMALPRFTGDRSDALAVNNYLFRSYRQYIEKMLAIGLGAATLSYGKFAYLFEDLAAKGVDFVDRFETMYRYLKKDKRSIGVNEQVILNETLLLRDCGKLGEDVVVCAGARRNYIYLKP
jgi:hypothetical protein